MEDKLKDLMNIAEDGISAIDNQVRDLEVNISRLEEQSEEEMSAVLPLPLAHGRAQPLCHTLTPLVPWRPSRVVASCLQCNAVWRVVGISMQDSA